MTLYNTLVGLLFKGIWFVEYSSDSSALRQELVENSKGCFNTKNSADKGVDIAVVIVICALRVTNFPGTPKARLSKSLQILTPSMLVVGGLYAMGPKLRFSQYTSP